MNRRFRAAARRFLVWRFGKSVDWRCTYLEIAAATNIDPKTVSQICRRHGYQVRGERAESSRSPMAVDNFISLKQPFMRQNY